MLLLIIDVSLTLAQCTCCGSSSNISAGELTPTSYALSKRKWLGELYSEVRFFNPAPNITSADHHGQTNTSLSINNVFITSLGLRYGINEKTTLLIQQPFICINGTSTSSKAFGDLLSLINYKVIGKPNFVLGLQAGMEWPTGGNIQYANGNSVITGSGSYDPVVGFNMIKSLKNSVLRFNTFFKYTSRGFNATNYGNFFGNQIGYSYFIKKSGESCVPDSILKKQSKVKPTFAINLQVSGEWLQAQMKDHAMVNSTGGYLALVGVGATVGFRGFTIPILLNAPLYQKFYGNQNQTKIGLRIGLTKTFN